MKQIPLALLFTAALFFSGCGNEQPTESSAKSQAREQLSQLFPNASEAFLEVAPHLDIGGPVFIFIDLEDDLRRFAQYADREIIPMLQEWFPPFITQVEVESFMEALHITGLRAVAMSSIKDGDYYRNRTVLYLPEGRKGLFRLYGDEEITLQNARRVPHYSLAFIEMEMEPAYIYDTIEESVGDLLGQHYRPMLQSAIRTAFMQVPGNFEGWLQGLPQSGMFYLYQDQDGKTVDIEGLEFPRFHFLARFSNLGGALESFIFPDLVSYEGWTLEEAADYRIYSPPSTPVMEWQPVLIVKDHDLYIADSREEFERFTEGAYSRNHLAQSGNFREIRQRLPDNMKSFYYVSPRLTTTLEEIFQKIAGEVPAQGQEIFEFGLSAILRDLPRERPIYGGHFNHRDGITFLSVGPRSHKATLASFTAFNPFVLGTMSAISIPAFQRVRETSRSNAQMNNLRQLAAAANQYFLETGNDRVMASELVGPDGFIYSLNQVHRERYGAGKGSQRDTPASPGPDGRFRSEDFEIRERDHNYIYAEDPFTGEILNHTF